MEMDSAESLEMLGEARHRAEKLVADLSRQREEVAAKPPELPAEQLAQGEAALNNALASARRMLENIDEALKIASVSSN